MVVEHVTSDQLYADADTDRLMEVVHGQRVHKQVGIVRSLIASRLGFEFFNWLDGRNLGRAFIQASFRLPVSGNDRKPDVSFVSYSKWGKHQSIPQVNAWTVVPDLVVEVISPHDKAFEVLEKVQEYFDSGVQHVWQVYSGVQQIRIYTSPTEVRILTNADELSDEPIVPGFRMPVAKLFPPSEPLAN